MFLNGFDILHAFWSCVGLSVMHGSLPVMHEGLFVMNHDCGVVGICVSAFPSMLHHAYLASYSTSSLVES